MLTCCRLQYLDYYAADFIEITEQTDIFKDSFIRISWKPQQHQLTSGLNINAIEYTPMTPTSAFSPSNNNVEEQSVSSDDRQIRRHVNIRKQASAKIESPSPSFTQEVLAERVPEESRSGEQEKPSKQEQLQTATSVPTISSKTSTPTLTVTPTQSPTNSKSDETKAEALPQQLSLLNVKNTPEPMPQAKSLVSQPDEVPIVSAPSPLTQSQSPQSPPESQVSSQPIAHTIESPAKAPLAPTPPRPQPNKELPSNRYDAIVSMRYINMLMEKEPEFAHVGDGEYICC